MLAISALDLKARSSFKIGWRGFQELDLRTLLILSLPSNEPDTKRENGTEAVEFLAKSV